MLYEISYVFGEEKVLKCKECSKGFMKGGVRVEQFNQAQKHCSYHADCCDLTDVTDELKTRLENNLVKFKNVKKDKRNFKQLVNLFEGIETNAIKSSTLEGQLEKLMKLLFSAKIMIYTIAKFNYYDQVSLKVLKEIEFDKASEKLDEIELAHKNKEDLETLSKQFFKLLKANYKEGVFKGKKGIKDHREKLKSLRYIAKAYDIISETNKETQREQNTFDACRELLKAEITLIEKKSSGIYNVIQEDVNNVKTKDGKSRCQISEVFEINREGERESFEPYEASRNRMLLWHGSRVSNIASIIGNGLNINGTSAHLSHFGRGLYFADTVSKSLKYCYPQSCNKIAILVLCEVALENMLNVVKYDRVYSEGVAGNINSVKGVGKNQPNGTGRLSPKGAVVPFGKLKHFENAGDFEYNEYVVYNENRVKIRYLVILKVD